MAGIYSDCSTREIIIGQNARVLCRVFCVMLADSETMAKILTAYVQFSLRYVEIAPFL